MMAIGSDSSSFQSPTSRIVELEDGDNTSVGTKRTNFVAKASKTPSRHDGKVIPFPLDPATIGNLPLLKQAAQDLAAHLGVVKARINQLEEEKRREKSTRNPWDLVSTDGAQ
jgi:glucosamine 6-phosphate synthetase-like amidotransferase/phosphosugar isomerase protein